MPTFRNRSRSRRVRLLLHAWLLAFALTIPSMRLAAPEVRLAASYPATVTSFKVVRHTVSSVSVSWTNPTGASFDRVRLRWAMSTSTSGGSVSTSVSVTLQKPTHSFTATSLSSGTTYSFSARAIDVHGNAGPVVSLSAQTVPRPVRNLQATTKTWNSVGLSW